MKKTFFKNLFRDIKKTLSRFLSIVIVIALGVAFYAGVRATSPDMKMSVDNYLNKSDFMDFKLISTLGITKEDVTEVQKLTGVKEAVGAYSIDAVFEKDDKLKVLNINSLPEESGINKITITSGKYPEKENQAIVEDRFIKENKLKIGDIVKLKSGSDTNIEDDLKVSSFIISGTAVSPMYLSAQRQLSSLGNGTVSGFVYILPSVFKSDVYTEMYVRTGSAFSKTSTLNYDEYKSENDKISKSLEDLGSVRGNIRYNVVLNDAKDKIDEAQNKLDKSKKEADEKFSEGYREINDAEKKIIEGKKQLSENEALFNKEMSKGEKKIQEGKNQIVSAENQINIKAKEAEERKLELAKAEKTLQENQDKLDLYKQQTADSVSFQVLNISPDIYNIIKGRNFDDMYETLKSAGVIEKFKPYFDMDKLKAGFDKNQAGITTGFNEISQKKAALEEGAASLESYKSEISLYKEKITEAEKKLNKSRAEGLDKLKKAKLWLTHGEEDIKENLGNLKAEEAKANLKIKEGEDEIQKNRDKLKDIKEPDVYVLGRSSNVGYETYRLDSDRIGNIGKVFPLIFFLVAALVSLTTMMRMVQENRTEIGTFKALGYSRFAIVSHYLIYALSASLAGSLIGISFGFRLFPPLIINAYGSLYTIPVKLTPFNAELALKAAFLAVLFTTAAAIFAAFEELREAPASLMRPKSPKPGKTILIEKISFIWKRFGFNQKVTARNLFRYKTRFFMTVIGIAACTGLMITGFGIKEGIAGATKSQMNKIYTYDIQVNLNNNIDSNRLKDLKSKVLEDDNIKSVMFAYSKNGKAASSDSSSQDVHIIVPETSNELNKYINLTIKDKNLNLPDNEIIITEKLSKLIDKKAGDTLTLTLNDKNYNIKIFSVTEHYLDHFVYMSPALYEKLTGDSVDFNEFFGLLDNTSESEENKTSNSLGKIKDIGSISFKNNVKIDYNKSMDSVNQVVLVLIISAAALAFVVIYTLTNININERKRELATIKLLGFYNNELAAYIYRENIILTIIGSVVGIGLGVILNNLVLTTCETNILMFLKSINPIYFLYSSLLTLAFSIIINLAMYKQFDDIDMIESLKSAE